MEVGLVGAYGQLVPNPVNPGHKLEQGAARGHALDMAGKTVQEQQKNSECVIRIPVQVS